MATAICSRLPRTTSPSVPWCTSSIWRALASVLLSSIARATILSTSTATGSSSGSSPCSRESSMTCWTSRPRRSLSMCIRPAKRCTASGSSAASITASDEQLDGADRGLQLVAHVGHEVAPDRLDAALAGAVLDEGEHQLRAERGHARRHVTRGQPLALHVQLGLADLAVASYLPDEIAQLAHGDLVAAHDPHRDGGRGGLQHRVVGVDDEGAAAQHGEHGGDAGRQRRLGSLGRSHLTFADPEREHDAAAQHGAEHREDEGLQRRAHVEDRTQGFIEGSPSRLCFQRLFATRSRNDAERSPIPK